MYFSFCPFCAARWDSVSSLLNTNSHKCLLCKVVLSLCVFTLINIWLIPSLPPSQWHLHLASQTLPASQQILCLYMAVSTVARAHIAFKRLTIPSVKFMRSSPSPSLITTTSPVSFFRVILYIKVMAKNILCPSLHILWGVTGGAKGLVKTTGGGTSRDRGLQVCGGAGGPIWQRKEKTTSRFNFVPYIDLYCRQKSVPFSGLSSALCCLSISWPLLYFFDGFLLLSSSPSLSFHLASLSCGRVYFCDVC